MQHCERRRPGKGNVHSMLNEQDGDGWIELLEQRGSHKRFGWGQASRRFVQEEQARAAGQSEGNLQLALLSKRG